MAVHRYGFNGKENDNEIKGEGNQQDYGMRVYDPRIGKFLSVDPLIKSYPELTPYQFASNRPIDAVDLDGAESAHWDPIRRQWMMPSDAIRHPLPPGAYMPSNGAAAAGSGNTTRGAIAAAAVVATVAAPYVAAMGRAAWAWYLNGGSKILAAAAGDATAAYSTGAGATAVGAGIAAHEIAAREESLGARIIAASEGPIELGGGRIFSHFTNAEGIQGITGASAEELGALEVGDRLIVNDLKFGSGTNEFKTRSGAAGEIFVTDQLPGISEGRLARMGVFKSTGKQQYSISFSEEAAFDQGVRVRGADLKNDIYTIPSNVELKGKFVITRNY